MKQHKWHKEIKAWADGAEIERIWVSDDYDDPTHWKAVDEPEWNEQAFEFRIKPQPKEPQYLYVYLDNDYAFSTIELANPWKYIGKIKMETDK